MKDKNIQQIASLYLKLALYKTFPHLSQCSIKIDSHGFSATFSSSDPFCKEYLELLETKMLELAKQEVQTMEMLASNAHEFCLHKGDKRVAKALAEIPGTVVLVLIGDQIEICEEPFTRCPFFSLLSVEQKGKKITLSARAFETSREKKTFLSKWRQYPQKNHSYFAKELELYEEGDWHSRGMQLRYVLMDLWRRYLLSEGIYEVETADPAHYFSMTNQKRFGCWSHLEDTLYFFDKAEVNSALQLMQKWINIFNFRVKWIFSPKRKGDPLKKAIEALGIDCEVGQEEGLEILVEDGLGLFRKSSKLVVMDKWVEFSLFGELKKFIELLLEQYEGDLPFWLCPEQVRLLPLTGVDYTEVIEIFNRQSIRYSVDEKPDLLKEKMHRALRVKVPYVMVFGKQEETSKQIKIRAYGSGLDKTMAIDKLEAFLSERKLESQ